MKKLFYILVITTFISCSGDEDNITQPTVPELTTLALSNITETMAQSGGNITSDGGAEITSRGIVWSTAQNPTIDLETKTMDGIGVGTFESNLSNLTSNTSYYVRAYASNSVGTAYGNELTFTTQTNPYIAMYPIGTVFCNNAVTAVADVTNPVTGKTWMDRNLGASQVATSSTDAAAYGDLYQWGRLGNGHQCRNSEVTTQLISSATSLSQHPYFIVDYYQPIDWLTSPNNNLWQGINGVNNPCPIGYRIPTDAEFIEEKESWEIGGGGGTRAFNSPLKLTMAGRRDNTSGNVFAGNIGQYWSSNVYNDESNYLSFDVGGVANLPIDNKSRADGSSVRCIKD